MSEQTSYPTKINLSAHEAEQYSMSIRLSSDGLLFALTPCADAVDEATYFEDYIKFPSNKHRFEEAVEEALFAHEFLLLPYRSTKIYYEPFAGILVPQDLYSPRNDEASDWMECLINTEDINRNTEVGICLSYSWEDEDKTFVGRYSRRLYSLLGRSLSSPRFVPYFVPYLSKQKQLSRQSDCRSLCVYLLDSKIDVLLLEEGMLGFYNTFEFVRESDSQASRGELLYYVYSLWKMLGLEGTLDKLILIDATPREGIGFTQGILSDLGELKKRIKIVEVVTLPRLTETKEP